MCTTDLLYGDCTVENTARMLLACQLIIALSPPLLAEVMGKNFGKGMIQHANLEKHFMLKYPKGTQHKPKELQYRM